MASTTIMSVCRKNDSLTGPLVSVVLPVRDGGEFLHEAVDSILQQDFTDFELLVIDDHSRDDAVQRLPEDPRLSCLPSLGHGVCAAFNTGLDCCRGRYVARMDADDISHPRRLGEQLEFLEANPEVTVHGSRVEVFTSHGPVTEGFRRYEQWQNSLLSHEDITRAMFVESPIVNPSMMARREALLDLGGYRDSAWPEDYDLWLRGFLHGWKFGKSPKTLLRWRDSDSRLTRTDQRYEQERFFDCKIHYLSRLLQLKGREVVIAGAGPTGKMVYRGLAKNGVKARAFLEVDPKKIGQSPFGVPVLGAASGNIDKSCYYLGSVGQSGARHRLSAFFLGNGLAELEDFYFLA